jgi:hypothetical protein
MRTLLTVLTTCCFSMPLTGAWANEPVKKAAVRELDLTDVYPFPSGKADKPIVFTNAKELMTKLNLCVKGGKHRFEERLKSVDFDKEQVLFFARPGSVQEKLTFKINSCQKLPSVVTGVTFQFQRDPHGNRWSQFHLIVLPKNTPWSVADEKNPTQTGG